MNTLDYLIKQNDQISMSMPECDNINTDGQDEEWDGRSIMAKTKKDGRKQKGQKAAEQKERVKKYKNEQQKKKKGKKPRKY